MTTVLKKLCFATTLRALMLSGVIVSAGICSTITETETNGSAANNTLATAQAIPASAFTSPAPAGVFNTSQSAVTINGFGGGQDIDFYSFLGSGAIQLSITDNPFTFATVLSLFDSTGHLLAFDDTSDPVKPGSASTLDSYIGSFVLPSAGRYYVAVSNAGASIPNYPDSSSCTGFGTLTRPDGGFGGISTTGCDTTSSLFAASSAQPATGSLAYTLVIAETPEPGTFVLLGSSLLGAFAVRRRNKNAVQAARPQGDR